jgi:hypothetical protein
MAARWITRRLKRLPNGRQEKPLASGHRAHVGTNSRLWDKKSFKIHFLRDGISKGDDIEIVHQPSNKHYIPGEMFAHEPQDVSDAAIQGPIGCIRDCADNAEQFALE